MIKLGRINCFGSKVIGRGWQIVPHIGINRLYYIISGGGSFVSGGKTMLFEQGRLYFFPSSIEFDPNKQDCLGMEHAYIDFELIPPVLYNNVISVDPYKSPECEAALGAFIIGAKGRFPERAERSSFYSVFKSAVTFLCEYMADFVGAAFVTDKVAENALFEMNAHFAQNLTISQLAKANYMSENGFIKHFKGVLGVTPYQYLKELRLRTAVYLRSTGMLLEEVAQRVGYADATSLTHALRKRYDIDN